MLERWERRSEEVCLFACLLCFIVFCWGGAVGVRGTMGGRGDKQNRGAWHEISKNQ